MLNILFISSDSGLTTGAFRSMTKLASILQEEYHHKIIVVLPKSGPGKSLLDKCGIKNITVRSCSWTVPIEDRKYLKIKLKWIFKQIINLWAVPQICKIIHNENIDLVHINTIGTYVGAKASLREQIPFIWHIREFLEEDHKQEIWDKEKGYALMRQTTHAVAISQSIYRKYAPIIGSRKISVIMNGIDPVQFYFSDHHILKRPIVQLLIVGRVKERKGQMDAIRACISLYQNGYQNIRLSIVGNDELEDATRFKKFVRENNASGYIKFYGESANVEKYYKEADIAFMCSFSEAFGRVTVEAMMAGCLVIGAENAATTELIKHGETGLLYTWGHADDLAEKVRYAIEHPGEVRKIAKCGQEDALQRMTSQINAEKIDKLYRKVMNGIND